MYARTSSSSSLVTYIHSSIDLTIRCSSAGLGCSSLSPIPLLCAWFALTPWVQGKTGHYPIKTGYSTPWYGVYSTTPPWRAQTKVALPPFPREEPTQRSLSAVPRCLGAQSTVHESYSSQAGGQGSQGSPLVESGRGVTCRGAASARHTLRTREEVTALHWPISHVGPSACMMVSFSTRDLWRPLAAYNNIYSQQTHIGQPACREQRASSFQLLG